MNLRNAIGRLNYLQQTRGFKIVASCVIALLTVAASVSYAVRVAAKESESKITVEDMPPESPEASPDQSKANDGSSKANEPVVKKAALDASAQIVNDILAAKQSTSGFIIGASIVMALALVVIWLSLGLTYLALIALAAILVGVSYAAGRVSDLGIASGGLVALFAAFSALVQLSRLLLSPSNSVMAIARNAVNEAVRMKISLIFIVLMVFGLACLPLILDPSSPLRYRVQYFLQYGTAGAFWIIAVLVLVFSVSTVAVEQRDKLIWQTMTKPVAAWQYVLGKWLGVSVLAAALLLVAGSGIFIFTEYMRGLPTVGETEAYVKRSGKGLTEDRFILETEVLTARTVVRPSPLELDEKVFRENVDARVESEIRNMSQNIVSADELRIKRDVLRQTMLDSLRKEVQMQYRVIAPGQAMVYRFDGLKPARESGRPILLRFKLESGSNRPDAEFKVTVQFAGAAPQVVPIALGQFQKIPMTPDVIDNEGRAQLQILNGDLSNGRSNSDALSFAPDGMEVSYSSGGFRANFFRCLGVLWVKLVFLSIIAICASTFLSFSVASLVSMTLFLAAEGAGFVSGALENYSTEDRDGKMMILPTITAKIATVVSETFRVYADLRPTGRLVDGIELGLGDVFAGTFVLGAASAILYVVAVYIFRRRELAIYSGQ